ncbi:MAG: NAD(P)H-hydrate dehydratase [Spirochaetales bacterium]|nr:NAD(P)H-hydrate dehydratase [Spirochaetales bacterium]
MRKIVSSAQMAAIDAVSIHDFGMSAGQLMEQAGTQAAEKILAIAEHRQLRKICIMVGTGHNGGDGLVIARKLARSLDVTVLLAGSGKGELWNINRKSCNDPAIKILVYDSEKKKALLAVRDAVCIVDCLTGTGLPAPARPPASELIALINQSHAYVISIDIPSGLHDGFTVSDSAVRADSTLYISLPKSSFFSLVSRPLCGKLEAVHIGFPDRIIHESPCDALLVSGSDIRDFYRPMLPADYKGTKGHLGVFSGNTGTQGAAWLASTAATHSGCGLVTAICAEAVYPFLASSLHAVMVKSDDLFDTAGLGHFQAFCAGPGWGKSEVQTKLLAGLLYSGLPGVLDADAIALFAGIPEKSASATAAPRLILTPHPGEFRALYSAIFGIPAAEAPSDIASVRKLAERLNCVIMFKACFTIIAAPGIAPYLVDAMFAPLAVAGAGDVLAGFAAGLLARGFDCTSAAVCAALIHLECAKKLYVKSGLFNSEQLAENIGKEASLYET